MADLRGSAVHDGSINCMWPFLLAGRSLETACTAVANWNHGLPSWAGSSAAGQEISAVVPVCMRWSRHICCCANVHAQADALMSVFCQLDCHSLSPEYHTLHMMELFHTSADIAVDMITNCCAYLLLSFA
jgi:hypothetical protein